MKRNSIGIKLNNSFAYRFNKFISKTDRPFILHLNNKKFNVPLMGLVGEGNTSLMENWFIQLIKSLKLPENSDFLDIGANIGQTLLAFKSCFENINYWGFEPNPVCVSYLENLVRANSFSKAQVLPIGLSSHSSVVKLYSQSNDNTSATISDEFRPGLYTQNEVKYVPVYLFDELNLAINNISLIKIDVEGAELDVINGMLKTIQKHQPVVTCEVLDYFSEESKEYSQKRANQLMECFSRMNYRAYRILHGKNKIQYKEITSISLRQWSHASHALNDYLFLPIHYASIPE